MVHLVVEDRLLLVGNVDDDVEDNVDTVVAMSCEYDLFDAEKAPLLYRLAQLALPTLSPTQAMVTWFSSLTPRPRWNLYGSFLCA